jgi:hypothetical protein
MGGGCSSRQSSKAEAVVVRKEQRRTKCGGVIRIGDWWRTSNASPRKFNKKRMPLNINGPAEPSMAHSIKKPNRSASNPVFARSTTMPALKIGNIGLTRLQSKKSLRKFAFVASFSIFLKNSIDF